MASTVLVSAYGCKGFLYGWGIRGGWGEGDAGAPKVKMIIKAIKC